MPFLTPEEMQSVKMEGSSLFEIPGLKGKKLRIMKMTAAAADAGKNMKTGSKPAEDRDFMIFMLSNGCATEAGVMLSKEDATQLFDVLPLDVVTDIVSSISKLMGRERPGNSEGSPPNS